MSNLINSLKIGTDKYVITLPYALCDTAAATAAKVASVYDDAASPTNFVLSAGARIVVRFTNANSASNPTLNINGTGAKAIHYKGATITASALIANTPLEFIYDGTNYQLLTTSETDTLATVTGRGASTATAISITNTTSSTSTGTGALIVSGGVGIGENLYVGGNLIVQGDKVTMNTGTLEVEDKNIELGKVAAPDTPSNATANGGGITLLAGTGVDKTITWDSTNSNWTSSEHWNIATGKEFKINNTSVLTSSTLGSGVTNSSLELVGSTLQFGVDGAVLDLNADMTVGKPITISGTADSAALVFDGDEAMVLTFTDVGYVLTHNSILNGAKISTAENERVANASLANSKITIGTTDVVLGATAATIAGLTLTTPVINTIDFSSTSADHTLWSGVTSGSINIGAGITSGGTINIGTSSAAAGTKNINIGTLGTSSAISAVTIGSNTTGSSVKINSVLQPLSGVSVTGNVTATGNLLPGTDNTGNVGNDGNTWAGGWFTNLYVDNAIIHGEDTNTYISFSDDIIDINAGTSSSADYVTLGSTYSSTGVIQGTRVKGGLYVVGNEYLAGNLYFPSDERLKTKQELIQDPSILEAVLMTDIWKFNYNTKPNEVELGVMAQDIEKNFPQLSDQLVSISDGEEFEDQRALKESKLIYVLWAALQEETKKRKELEEKINKIMERLEM